MGPLNLDAVYPSWGFDQHNPPSVRECLVLSHCMRRSLTFYSPFLNDGGSAYVSTKKKKKRWRHLLFLPFPPQAPQSNTFCRDGSEWVRCGCRGAHKSYKHWGNVFQTCLPGVICRERATPLRTKAQPSASIAPLQLLALGVVSVQNPKSA